MQKINNIYLFSKLFFIAFTIKTLINLKNTKKKIKRKNNKL